MNKKDLIDRVTSEVMKIYNVPGSNDNSDCACEPEKTVPRPTMAAPRINASHHFSAPSSQDSSRQKALVLVCGNSPHREDTLEKFKVIRQSYRQAKVILSGNAKRLYESDSQRPFAGYEYLDDTRNLDDLHAFDQFIVLNPTLNTLSKMAALQGDNQVALIARKALLWGKAVRISLSEIPRLPSGMMQEFNGILQKLKQYGYEFDQEVSQSLPVGNPLAIASSPSSVSRPHNFQAPLGPVLNPAQDRELAQYIDHTILKPETTLAQIQTHCKEASDYGFFSVCVNPYWIETSARLLQGTGVKVCTVIGFPLGANTPELKAWETAQAIQNGADEIDMVLNIGAMKSGDYDAVRADIKAVVDAAAGTLVKVIFETALLSREEILIACRLSKEAGAHYVKTSTGFSKGGATAEHIQLMRNAVGNGIGVKASGGVRSTADARAMIAAGASRVGASASIAIVTGKDAGAGKY